VPTRIADDAVRAFESLLASVADDDIVLVTGSLFLIGEIYPALESWRERTRGGRSSTLSLGR
jgi:folylpolyglutamate synthase/dihydropteroate synthase